MSISHRLREKNVCLFNPVDKVDPKFVFPWDTPRKPNPLSSGEIQRGQNSAFQAPVFISENHFPRRVSLVDLY